MVHHENIVGVAKGGKSTTKVGGHAD
jgi:hypothetical protein